MSKFLLMSLLVLLLGCSELLRTPTVNTNAQIAKQANQTLGVSNNSENTFKVVRPQARVTQQQNTEPKVNTDSVENIIQNEVSLIIVLILISLGYFSGLLSGWLIPSPSEILRMLFPKLFKRN